MDNSTFDQLKDFITKSQNIGVVTGKNPTLDEMGAALALYLSLTATGKAVTIAAPDEPIVELSSLVGINKIKPNLVGEGGDLTVSFPYNEGEIDKVSYTLENGFLNIVVKAGEQGLSFSEKDVRYAKSKGAPELLFVVGTPRLSDLGNLFNPADLKNTTVVNLDNKVDNQGFGDIVMASPRLSSVSEIVTNLIFNTGLKIDRDIAQNLMIGLTRATDDFRDPKTSYLAFEMAGVLLRSGATRLSSLSLRDVPFGQVPASQRDEQDVPPVQKTSSNNDFIAQLEKRIQQERVQEEAALTSGSEGQAEEPRIIKTEKKETFAPPAQAKKQTVVEDNAPEDWLTPKIYKGSTNF